MLFGAMLFSALALLAADFATVFAVFVLGTDNFVFVALLTATDFPDVFGIGLAAFFLIGVGLLDVAVGFFVDFKVIAPWQNTEPLSPRRSVRNGFVWNLQHDLDRAS